MIDKFSSHLLTNCYRRRDFPKLLPSPSMLTAHPLLCFWSLQQAYSDPHLQAWHRRETNNKLTENHVPRVQLGKYGSRVWMTKIKYYGEKQSTNHQLHRPAKAINKDLFITLNIWSSVCLCGELKIITQHVVLSFCAVQCWTSLNNKSTYSKYKVYGPGVNWAKSNLKVQKLSKSIWRKMAQNQLK